MRLHRLLAVAVTAATFLSAAACSNDNRSSDNGTTNAVDKVNYLTGFGLYGREAYVYVALEKGYFREAGIEVSIKPGGTTGDNLKILSSGQADFCPIDFAGMLIEAGNGSASGLTAVAAIHQNTLSALITLEGKGITSPKDLEGKTIGNPPGGIIGTLFPTYARLAGIDASKVNFVSVAPPQLPQTLAAGRADAIGQFAVGKPTIEAAAGGKTAIVLPYSDYLTDLYGNTLVTSTKLANDKPDLVKRFREALLKGLVYAIDNPAEAAQILVKHEAGQNEKAAAAELELMKPYVRTNDSATVGLMDNQRVARGIAILQGAGALKPGLTPEQVVSFDLVPKA